MAVTIHALLLVNPLKEKLSAVEWFQFSVPRNRRAWLRVLDSDVLTDKATPVVSVPAVKSGVPSVPAIALVKNHMLTICVLYWAAEILI